MRFFRNGREITESEACDERGILRDGVTARIALTARDSAPGRRIVDANGDAGLALCCPGYRQLVGGDSLGDQGLRDERRQAYRDYQNSMSRAWRSDAAPDEDANRNQNESRDHRSIAQRMADHQRTMQSVYDSYAAEMSHAWKAGK
jgi:hypothetical protein